MNINNFTDLDKEIHSEQKVITLDGDVILETNEQEKFQEGILVDVNDIVIDCAGFTINAQKKTRIFRVTGKNVTIKNATLKNGYSSDGGTILNEGEVTLINVTLLDNYGRCECAAIGNHHGIIKLIKCRFKNNSSEVAPVLYNQSDSVAEITDSMIEENTADLAGAIGNLGELKLERTTIQSNNSKTYGGAISNIGTVRINDSVIINNCAKNGGGAIDNQQNGIIKITGTRLEKNNSEYGGAVYSRNSNIHIENSSFVENSSNKGGAINHHSDDTITSEDSNFEVELICSDCIFDNNQAKLGGAVWTNDHIDFDKCSFRGNLSEEEGNVIYFNSISDIQMDINDSFIENTEASNSDIYLKNPSLTNIKNLTVKNISDNYVIHNEDAAVKISNIHFDNDKKAVYNNNVALIDDDALERFIECAENSVIHNYNKKCSCGNGFGYLEGLINADSDVIHLDCDIIMDENERIQYIEGIELKKDNITIDGQNHTIDAKKLSRIFKISAKNITLKNIQFKNGCYHKRKFCEDNDGGGSIYALDDASVTIMNCTFTENDSNNSAGCINNRGIMDIRKSIFKNNYAQRICSTIFNDKQLNLYDCKFEKNFAPSNKSCRDAYLKTRGNIVNKGKMTFDKCNFKNTLLFCIELVKFSPTIPPKYKLFLIMFSLYGMIIGCFVTWTLANLNNPVTRFIRILTLLCFGIFMIYVFGMVIEHYAEKYIQKFMRKHGFENYEI
ncbi:MAG: hypothetical protein Q4Q22_05030 [Methanosphaera sp.]|nr:hypothetical protein [Methanosphaera sp.]